MVANSRSNRSSPKQPRVNLDTYRGLITRMRALASRLQGRGRRLVGVQYSVNRAQLGQVQVSAGDTMVGHAAGM
jgi:hypothetical protein